MAMIVLTNLIKKDAPRETGFFQLYNTQKRCMDLWRIGDDGKILVVKRNVDKSEVN